MPEITFIFSTNETSTKFYGKIVLEYLSDDNEGLDSEIRPIIIHFLEIYLKSICDNGDNKIYSLYIGVLGLIKDHYTSKNDRILFDLYINENEKYCKIFGKEINYS